MSDSCTQLIQRIQTEHQAGRLVLPSLPEIVIRIRDAVNDDSANLREIVRLIQLDQGLSARLVQIANSPLYRTGQAIENCQMAVSRLGLSVSRDIVTCLVLHNMFNSEQPNLRNRVRALWKHSCHVAGIAAVIARFKPGIHPDKALLAGLLHDIGELPILHYASEFPEIINADEMLNEVIGQLKVELGKNILQAWHFDEDFIFAVEHSENWMRETDHECDYADIVMIAQLHSLYGSVQDKPLPSLLDVPAFHKLSLSKMGPDASMEVLFSAENDIRAVVAMLQ